MQRLEHVPVADVRRHDAHAALLHQTVEAEVRHARDRDEIDAEVQREDRDDLVAVHHRAVAVDREHAVAVTIEGDAEIEPAVAHGLLQERKVRRAAPDVDVVAIRRVPDRRHVRAEAFECRRRYACAAPCS